MRTRSLGNDVVIEVSRGDLQAAQSALAALGYTCDGQILRHVSRATHRTLRVIPDDVMESAVVQIPEGILIAPVADLVRMKLTDFRLKDKVHVQDLDAVGLITLEIEASLSEPLRVRLVQGN